MSCLVLVVIFLFHSPLTGSLFLSPSGGSRGAHSGLQPEKDDEERLGEKNTTIINRSYMRILYGFFFPSLTLTVLSQTGGAIITSLSQTGSVYTSKSAYLPQELLGEVRGHFIALYHYTASTSDRRLVFSSLSLTLIISEEVRKSNLTSRLHHSSLESGG